jgi:transcription antitermination factor NusG
MSGLNCTWPAERAAEESPQAARAQEATGAWYAAYVRPGHELRVAHALAERGFDAFCPVETVWRRHSRKREAVSRPLFVRYLFVAIDHPRQSFLTATSTDGLDRLLGAPRPREVPAAVIEGLRQAQGEGLFNHTQRRKPHRFRSGQTVEITGGPFTGFLAEVIDAGGDGKRRVRVLFQALGGGRATAGVVDAGRLRAV